MRKTLPKNTIQKKFSSLIELHKALIGAQYLCRYVKATEEYKEKILSQYLTNDIIDAMESTGIILSFNQNDFREKPYETLNTVCKNLSAYNLHQVKHIFKGDNVKASKLLKALQESRETVAKNCTDLLHGLECLDILTTVKNEDIKTLSSTINAFRFKKLLLPAIEKSEWRPDQEDVPANLFGFINNQLMMRNLEKAKFNINALLNACAKNLEAIYHQEGLCDEEGKVIDEKLIRFIQESRHTVQTVLNELIFQKAQFDLSGNPAQAAWSAEGMFLALAAKISRVRGNLKNTKILGLICAKNPLFPNQLDTVLKGLSTHKELRTNQRFIIAIYGHFATEKRNEPLLNAYGFPMKGNNHGVFLDIQFDKEGNISIFLDDFFGIMADEDNYYLNEYNHRHLILSTIAKHFPTAECYLQCFVLNGQAIQSDSLSCLAMVLDAVGVACKTNYHEDLSTESKKHDDIKVVPLNEGDEAEKIKIHMLRAKHLPEKLFLLYRPIQSQSRLNMLPTEALEYVYKGLSLKETVESHLDEEFGFNTYIVKRAKKVSDKALEYAKDQDLNGEDFANIRKELSGEKLEKSNKKIIDLTSQKIKDKDSGLFK